MNFIPSLIANFEQQPVLVIVSYLRSGIDTLIGAEMRDFEWRSGNLTNP